MQGWMIDKWMDGCRGDGGMDGWIDDGCRNG